MLGYLLPPLAAALVLALALREIPLSDVAGMVARGEAVESEEDLPVLPAGSRAVPVPGQRDSRDDDPLRVRRGQSAPAARDHTGRGPPASTPGSGIPPR